jgi:hypothetical protein
MPSFAAALVMFPLVSARAASRRSWSAWSERPGPVGVAGRGLAISASVSLSASAVTTSLSDINATRSITLLSSRMLPGQG